jgi:hypothetical protein
LLIVSLRPGSYAAVGWPKFEVVRGLNPDKLRLFDNNNPVIVYNPHFDQKVSSWGPMGLGVLNFFAKNSNYNLIFASHVVLFKRFVRHKGFLPKKYRGFPNILIDTGSQASADMTYMLNSDIYLGDVSGQVYEFLLEPRPCIHLSLEPRMVDRCRGRCVDRGRVSRIHDRMRAVVRKSRVFDEVVRDSLRHGDDRVGTAIGTTSQLQTLRSRAPRAAEVGLGEVVAHSKHEAKRHEGEAGGEQSRQVDVIRGRHRHVRTLTPKISCQGKDTGGDGSLASPALASAGQTNQQRIEDDEPHAGGHARRERPFRSDDDQIDAVAAIRETAGEGQGAPCRAPTPDGP